MRRTVAVPFPELGVSIEAPSAEAPITRVPPPLSINELIALDEPEEDFLVNGLIPTSGNVLIAAYPKTCKTWLLLHLAMCVALGKPFLGKFDVPQRRRVGLILMEDRTHRVRRRLRRLCLGMDATMDDLEGWLFLWFRPPRFKLSDPLLIAELAGHVDELNLEMLGLDNWTNVASGKSNESDDVAPQLDAFRDACGDACTPVLVHHAKKNGGNDTENQRLTDLIRNSGAFGGWYDAGILLERKNEASPVRVRMEMRDDPGEEPFAFELEDEYPKTDTQSSSGWVRLSVSATAPAILDRQAAAERFVPAVLQYLRDNPGTSKNKLKGGIAGDNLLIEAAFDALCDRGQARCEESTKRGVGAKCYAI